MYISNKILRILAIPHLALLSVIFGMMLVSFPFGAFVVFNTDMGDDINFEYPIGGIDGLKEFGSQMNFDIEIGDVFIVLWSSYAVLFSIAFLGPRIGFLQTLSAVLNHGRSENKTNYMITITKWFSLLILVSVVIDLVQKGFGIVNTPPQIDNTLNQFLFVTLAPFVEELAFRVILIGLPLFLFYSNKFALRHFFKSLWNPSYYLQIDGSKKIFVLIFMVGMIFGFAHIMTDESWSEGKFAQATASGIILGWLYFRFGLITAILVHWGVNYFVFSYATFISQLNGISIESSFSHPLMNTMEIIFIIAGVFSIFVMLFTHLYSKNESKIKIK